MSYPAGVTVHTITLPDADPANVVPTFVVTFLACDGEVYTLRMGGPSEPADYLDVQNLIGDYADEGTRCLMVIEGEHDMTTGEYSAWSH